MASKKAHQRDRRPKVSTYYLDKRDISLLDDLIKMSRFFDKIFAKKYKIYNNPLQLFLKLFIQSHTNNLIAFARVAK